ncbi:DUF4097 family beta strand repeat-containing protein [Streptomyces sp. NPDC090112]|uniref:DUF4097 family beta strand repeat-containing protein n=1 Tax=Streptomyces sp. NPDC090112 TaxID=3365949 RepID=UPI0038277939
MTSHTTRTRVLRVPAAVLAAAVLTAGCSFVGGGPRRTATADATVTEAVAAVELTGVRSGSIEVTPGAGPGVTVRRTVHYRGATTPVPGQRVSGGVLTFTDGCSGDCRVDYRLEVPAAATVRLKSASGRIAVTGVAGADLRASSGDVTADRMAGPVRIRTSSGGITATALSAAQADVRSDSGDARLDFAQAPASVRAETSSGDLALEVPRAPYRLAVSTTSGDREIDLPDDSAAPSHLTARTTSGDVRITARG